METIVLVSPSEPPVLRKLGDPMPRALEVYGADVLYATKQGLVGVQRKEISDLISSVQDGRLQKQVAQMKQLVRGVVLIEGEDRWTNEGILIGNNFWTKSQHLGVIWSLQLEGFWIAWTYSLTATSDWLTRFGRWLSENKTTGLQTRKKVQSQWGQRDNRDWVIGVLSQIDGINAELAGRIYDKFGCPLRWTVTEEELCTIERIGLKTARKMLDCLSPLKSSPNV